MNRFNQIRNTLPKNLEDNIKYKNKIEFILVDFNSKDGLKEWILNNFKQELQDNYLKYYYTEELIQWHAPIAKNTSSMLGTGKYIVNLDCDNYTGEEGGKWVLDKFYQFGDNLLLHQSLNIYKSGTMGRISMLKDNFIKLGGYNEQFFPMSHLDGDIIERGKIFGLIYHNDSNNKYNKAILNNKDESVINCINKDYNTMKKINLYISKFNILNNEIIANNYKKHNNLGINKNIYRLL